MFSAGAVSGKRRDGILDGKAPLPGRSRGAGLRRAPAIRANSGTAARLARPTTAMPTRRRIRGGFGPHRPPRRPGRRVWRAAARRPRRRRGRGDLSGATVWLASSAAHAALAFLLMLSGFRTNEMLRVDERDLSMETAFNPPEEHKLLEESRRRDIFDSPVDELRGAPSLDEEAERIAPEPLAPKPPDLSAELVAISEPEWADEPPVVEPRLAELEIPLETILAELPPAPRLRRPECRGIRTPRPMGRFRPGVTSGLGPGCVDLRGDPRLRLRAAENSGGGADTEKAVELALQWLARQQAADGTWNSGSVASPEDQGCLATQGLAALAFLGAGYHHISGRHSRVVGRSLEWLIRGQRADGCWSRRTRDQEMHAQGIAALALVEATMSSDQARLSETLNRAALRAVRFIERAQCPHSAWGYTPKSTHIEQSCVIWNGMALKAARTAKLPVGKRPFEYMAQWLDDGQGRGGNYSYSGEYDRGRRATAGDGSGSACMVAAALMMRFWTGTRPGRKRTRQSANMVIEELKSTADALDGSVGAGVSPDLYFLHHGAIAMFQMGGVHWQSWNRLAKPLVLGSQHRDGHWTASGHAINDVMATALGALVLESYYRYSPLYRDPPVPAVEFEPPAVAGGPAGDPAGASRRAVASRP
jgi:hypothetical protein